MEPHSVVIPLEEAVIQLARGNLITSGGVYCYYDQITLPVGDFVKYFKHIVKKYSVFWNDDHRIPQLISTKQAELLETIEEYVLIHYLRPKWQLDFPVIHVPNAETDDDEIYLKRDLHNPRVILVKQQKQLHIRNKQKRWENRKINYVHQQPRQSRNQYQRKNERINCNFNVHKQKAKKKTNK